MNIRNIQIVLLFCWMDFVVLRQVNQTYYECKEERGYVRDIYDCRLFWVCYGRSSIQLSCPTGTVFALEEKKCMKSTKCFPSNMPVYIRHDSKSVSMNGTSAVDTASKRTSIGTSTIGVRNAFSTVDIVTERTSTVDTNRKPVKDFNNTGNMSSTQKDSKKTTKNPSPHNKGIFLKKFRLTSKKQIVEEARRVFHKGVVDANYKHLFHVLLSQKNFDYAGRGDQRIFHCSKRKVRYFKHEWKVHQFYKCVGDTLHLYQCPFGWIWSKQTLLCQHSE